MRTKRKYIDYLQDMLENSSKAIEFASGMSFEQFNNDPKTGYAVVRALEIVGEAAKKVPEDFRNSNPGIPWREITGTRDKLIHEYFGVNWLVIWKTVQEDLPPLTRRLQSLLDDFKED